MSDPQYPIDLPTDDQVRYYLLENSEAARTLGIDSDFEVRFLARGAVNAAYRLTVPGQVDRVLRIALYAANRSNVTTQVECEAAVLQFLSGKNVTADLAWIDLHGGSLGYPLLAIGYLDGEPLDYRPAHLKACARLYARLHSQTGEPPAIVPRVADPLTQYLKEAQVWVDRYRHWSQANPDTIAAFDAALDRIQARSIEFDEMRLIHGDGTWGNWRIQDEEARLMDWDWCRVTTPAADLAHFLSPITTGRLSGKLLSREEENLVLEEYCRSRQISLIEFERLFRGMRSIVVFHSITWTGSYLIELCQAQSSTAAEPEFLQVQKTSGLAQQLDPEFLDWMRREQIW